VQARDDDAGTLSDKAAGGGFADAAGATRDDGNFSSQSARHVRSPLFDEGAEYH
jgi:hypothetical protein